MNINDLHGKTFKHKTIRKTFTVQTVYTSPEGKVVLEGKCSRSIPSIVLIRLEELSSKYF